ncbi:MAG: hypothetical protein COB78_10055 [Hyphomicrobiales bacterium]|nr:MAG: hypothetical protein COB78_10055 [Hyphomicrobiales bacterium]
MSKTKRRNKKSNRRIKEDTIASTTGIGQDTVQRNMSDNFLYMYRRKSITEEQYQTGEKYRQAYLVWSGQTNMAIDYTQPRVDTSGTSQSISDAQIDAANLIKEVNKGLDLEQRYILQMMVGENWTVKEYAYRRHGLVGRHAMREQMKALKQTLDICAQWWGYAPRAKTRHTIRSADNLVDTLNAVDGDWGVYARA